MISWKKIRSYFLLLLLFLACIAGFLFFSLFVCFKEPADEETRRIVLNAEPYEGAVFHRPNRYQEAVRLISAHQQELMALTGSEGDALLLTRQKKTFTPTVPEPLATWLLRLIDLPDQELVYVYLFRDGRVKLRLKTRTDSENYLYLFHSVTNHVTSSSSNKSVRLGHCYYEIEVGDAFNDIDPCNFAPN